MEVSGYFGADKNGFVNLFFFLVATVYWCADDVELRTLQSLPCGEKKVLKKIPPGREVDDGDMFRFNEEFGDPRAKVHINSVQAKVSVRLVLLLRSLRIQLMIWLLYFSLNNFNGPTYRSKAAGNTTSTPRLCGS